MLLERPISRFDEFYTIYESAFPAVERRTRKDQKKILEHPYYHVRAIEEDGAILAFLGYWDLPGCVFIEHLATDGRCRGKGYGKNLVLECLEGVDKPVFLEIEPVTDQDPMTGRRAAFYERLGFYVNRFPYNQMPLQNEHKPLPLWIMSYGSEIGEQEFEPYKTEIYRIVYQVEQ